MLRDAFSNISHFVAYEWAVVLLCTSMVVFRKQYRNAIDTVSQVKRMIARSIFAATIFFVEAVGVLANYLGIEGTYIVSKWCISHFIPFLFFIIFNIAEFLLPRIIAFFSERPFINKKTSVIAGIISFIKEKRIIFLQSRRVLLIQ